MTGYYAGCRKGVWKTNNNNYNNFDDKSDGLRLRH